MGFASRSRIDWRDLLRQAKAVATVESVYGHDGKRQGRHIRYFCPWHSRDDQGDPRERRLAVDTTTLGWKCFHGGCERSGDVLAWFNGGERVSGSAFFGAVAAFCQRVGVQVPADALHGLDGLDPPEASSGVQYAPEPSASADAIPPSQDTGREDDARRMWADSRPVGSGDLEPARRWVAEGGPKWGCWPPDRDWPAAVRWLPDAAGAGGSLIAAVASLAEWRAHWPDIPPPDAVHLIHLSGEGEPSKDRGGKLKRNYGSTSGKGVLIAPEASSAPAKRVRSVRPLAVCEGVADAMAIVTWVGYSAFALLGTSTRSAPDLARVKSGTIICGDRDPPGQQAQRELIAAIRSLGGKTAPWRIAEDRSDKFDPADWAREKVSAPNYECLERDAIRTERTE